MEKTEGLMKAGTQNKVKFKLLQRRLKLSLWQTVGLLETLWLSTYTNAPSGDIGRLTNEEIAAALEWDGDADDLIRTLVETRWLDTDDVHRLIIHDWSEHCAKYLKGGFAHGGKQFADVEAKQRAKPGAIAPEPKLPATPTAQATSHQANPIQSNSIQAKPIPNTCSSDDEPARGNGRASMESLFSEWWGAYPRKIGKDAAKKAFAKAIPTIAKARACDVHGALAWLSEKTSEFAGSDKAKGEFCPYPATWLNEGRYDDDPKEWTNRNGNNHGRNGASKSEPGPGLRFREPAA